MHEIDRKRFVSFYGSETDRSLRIVLKTGDEADLKLDVSLREFCKLLPFPFAFLFAHLRN